MYYLCTINSYKIAQMKQKLTVIVHKFDKRLLLVKSQSDLSTLLGVSISTIKRNYNKVGIYDTATYTVYVGAQYYDNGIESKYRHDVTPPKPKLYNSTQRTNNTELIAQKNYSNQNIVQSIEDEPIEKEWFDIESDLLISEYRVYYLRRTEDQLHDSYNYFISRPGSSLRISTINECAKIKQLE